MNVMTCFCLRLWSKPYSFGLMMLHRVINVLNSKHLDMWTHLKTLCHHLCGLAKLLQYLDAVHTNLLSKTSEETVLHMVQLGTVSELNECSWSGIKAHQVDKLINSVSLVCQFRNITSSVYKIDFKSTAFNLILGWEYLVSQLTVLTALCSEQATKRQKPGALWLVS